MVRNAPIWCATMSLVKAGLIYRVLEGFSRNPIVVRYLYLKYKLYRLRPFYENMMDSNYASFFFHPFIRRSHVVHVIFQ